MVSIGGTICLDPSTDRGRELLKGVMNAKYVSTVEVDTVHDDGNINFVVMMGVE